MHICELNSNQVLDTRLRTLTARCSKPSCDITSNQDRLYLRCSENSLGDKLFPHSYRCRINNFTNYKNKNAFFSTRKYFSDSIIFSILSYPLPTVCFFYGSTKVFQNIDTKNDECNLRALFVKLIMSKPTILVATSLNQEL